MGCWGGRGKRWYVIEGVGEDLFRVAVNDEGCFRWAEEDCGEWLWQLRQKVFEGAAEDCPIFANHAMFGNDSRLERAPACLLTT
jgi:hypothetical protein